MKSRTIPALPTVVTTDSSSAICNGVIDEAMPGLLHREPDDVNPRNDENGQARFHPAAALFPLMSGRDYGDLVDDITKYGLRDPIILHPNGTILDGRNRYRACHQAKVEPTYITWAGNLGTEIEFVFSVNLHRRHLTAEQKREVIAKLLRNKPELSNATIGRMSKVDDKTVASQRRKMEATSEIPKLSKTIGADGKARFAKRGKVGAKVMIASTPDTTVVVADALPDDAGGELFEHRKRQLADLEAAWDRADSAVRQTFHRRINAGCPMPDRR